MGYQSKYEILGITINSTEKEIKSAYRKLAKKFHPDVNKDPQATEIFEKINNAYEEIMNIDTRADKLFNFNSNFEMGDDFFGVSSDDIFENDTDSRMTKTAPPIEQLIYVTIKEALFGKEMSIDIFINVLNKKTYDVSVDVFTIDISIPPGIKNNHQIVKKGIGNEMLGRDRGDICFSIIIEEELSYQINAHDIMRNFKISKSAMKQIRETGNVVIDSFDGLTQIRWDDKFLDGETTTIPNLGYPKTIGDLSNRGNLIISFFLE